VFQNKDGFLEGALEQRLLYVRVDAEFARLVLDATNPVRQQNIDVREVRSESSTLAAKHCLS